MKAIVQDRYGSADVLELAAVDQPAPEDDELLVRVHAAGVDAGAWHLMTGLPYLIRLAGYGLRKPRQRIRGRELAGRVEAVGRDVTRFRPGDEVYGIGEGAFAEFARVPQKRAAPKPVNLGFEQAAAVPISAITALQGLRDKGRLQPGQRVMVIGAAGGVGSFAVQLAKAFGAHVTGVVSTTKTDLARSIGADEVVDYTREDATDGRRRYDLVLDTAGNRPLSSLRRALTPKGTLVIVGGEAEGRWLGGTERLLRAGLLSPFVGQRLLGFVAGEGADDLRALTDLIEAGKVAPVIDRTYPLDQAPEALRYWAEGHARGKVVVTI
jgi:NADPH:quinone reductase-like Zn-dependent oxidoreductase